MINQVILALLDARRRTEIYSVFLAYVFDLFPRPGQPDDRGVEFGEVGREHGGGVAGGVAGYEDWEEWR